MKEELKRVPIHRSLVEPVQILGAERKLVFVVGFTSASIFVAGMNLLSIVLSLATWSIGMMIARSIAKIDPQFLEINIRAIKAQYYYPATEKLETPVKRIKRN